MGKQDITHPQPRSEAAGISAARRWVKCGWDTCAVDWWGRGRRSQAQPGTAGHSAAPHMSRKTHLAPRPRAAPMVEAPTQERPNQAEVRTRTLRARGSTTWGYLGIGLHCPRARLPLHSATKRGLVAAREAAKLGTRLCGPDSRGIRRSQSPPVCGPREQVGEGRGSRARVCCTMREAARNAGADGPLTGMGAAAWRPAN